LLLRWFMLRSATFLSIEIEKKFVADFADFVADFVAEKTKPLDNQEVLRV